MPSGAIAEHVEDKAVGETESLKEKIDNASHDIFCMKTPEYIMKSMATYGGLKEPKCDHNDIVWLQNGASVIF